MRQLTGLDPFLEQAGFEFVPEIDVEPDGMRQAAAIRFAGACRLHFRFATTRGLQLGQQVGAYSVGTLLTPQH